jgi:hypothetical protein
MRWFEIQTAKITPEMRELLEQYGPETMRTLLLVPNNVLENNGLRTTVADSRGFVLQWLKEQTDREERKETWLITMECAITVFVLFELAISIWSLLHGYSK